MNQSQEIPSLDEVTNKIHDMYKDLTYFDMYGGNVFFFIILIIVMFVVVSYFMVMKNIQPIKENWPTERCKPQNIPFAGLINKPSNMSFIDYTKENFDYCMQNVLISISGEALQPLQFITSLLTSLYNTLVAGIDSIRGILSNIVSSIENISKEIFGRISNVIIILQQIVISFMDSISKVQGVLVAGLFTALGTYDTLKALFGVIIEFIITLLIILGALIAAMWLLPFTWPIAITNTAIFLAISIPLAIILTFMQKVMHVDVSRSIPGVPSMPDLSSCFDKDTMISMNDGTMKKISDIHVGDILKNNVIVTGKMKLDARNANMCNLYGIYVSSTHQVLFREKWNRLIQKDQWIYVDQHPDSVRIENYNEPYIYCLNTSAKTICIDDVVFADWDETFEKERKILMKIIYSLCSPSDSYPFYKPESPNVGKMIHKYLDGGFTESTLIPLADGSRRKIKDIWVGDVLKEGNIVYGIVEIDGSELNAQYEYEYNHVTFYGGPNMNMYDSFSSLKLISTLGDMNSLQKKSIKKEEKLYHLLTNKGYFYVSGIKDSNNKLNNESKNDKKAEYLKFHHYNFNIDIFTKCDE